MSIICLLGISSLFFSFKYVWMYANVWNVYMRSNWTRIVFVYACVMKLICSLMSIWFIFICKEASDNHIYIYTLSLSTHTRLHTWSGFTWMYVYIHHLIHFELIKVSAWYCCLEFIIAHSHMALIRVVQSLLLCCMNV
jgi:hypothetical protein